MTGGPAWTRRRFSAAVGLGLAGLAGCAGGPSTPGGKIAAVDAVGTMYKSAGCSCCDRYAAVLAESGLPVAVEVTDRRSTMWASFGVPDELASCHTIDFDGRAVEGHVPLAAVEAFLSRDTDLVAIALPGMPAGSPGMGGDRSAPFVVYGVRPDGAVDRFMVL